MATTLSSKPHKDQQQDGEGDDFQYWYDSVWQGFADNTPVSSETDLEHIYNGYTDESSSTTEVSSMSSPISSVGSANTGQVSRASSGPSTYSMRQQIQQRASSAKAGVRPLPQPPGMSSPPIPTFSMPEPDPYQQPSDHRGAGSPLSLPTSPYPESSSSSLDHRLGAGATRSTSRARSPIGLPSDPRPPNRVTNSHSSNGSGGYNGSYNQQQQQQEWSPVAADDYQNPVTRRTSARPHGTLAPTPPGASYLNPDPSSYDANGTNHSRSVSQNTIGPGPYNSYNSGSVDQSSIYADSIDLGRSTSATSSISISQNPLLSRNASLAAAAGIPSRNPSTGSDPYQQAQQQQQYYQPQFSPSSDFRPDLHPSPQSQSSAGPSGSGGGGGTTRKHDLLQTIAAYKGKGPLELHEENADAVDDEYWEEEEDEDDNQFVNYSLLSHVAVQLRDRVPRATHVKGSVPFPRAFTGRDVVSTIQSLIQRELCMSHNIPAGDRRFALEIARSLQSQLFFFEVEWGGRVLQDGVEDVYMFQDDSGGSMDGGEASGSGAGPSSAADMMDFPPSERAELPTGVITIMTQCYSPSCGEGPDCYAYACPRKGNFALAIAPGPPEPAEEKSKDWATTVEKEVLNILSESEINRQTIIHKVISKEEQYLQDLDIVESCFIRPLRNANPPPMEAYKVDDFIDEVFGNILDLRECNRRLLEVMYVRQREQAPVIQRIGDVFLDAATEFRLAYPTYLGNLPLAEKRLKEEIDGNDELRIFFEQCSRQTIRHGEAVRPNLKHYLNRPSEHLQKYPALLKAIYKDTQLDNPDADFLKEAIEAITNLQSVAQLRTFQSAMCKGITAKWEWSDLVSQEVRLAVPKAETKRQFVIFELIKGEMAYVKDLENIELMYVRPLRAADPPVIPPHRLNQFITDVFHNFAELHTHHRRLVEQFHEIQREEHPIIRSISAAVFDAALNFREAYMEYIPNYPIAAYRIDDEMATNPLFKQFVDQCVRHPDAHRLDMKNFINRPIPRLLRYELLLKNILDETPAGHEDKETIPQIIDVIKALGKETEPGVVSAKTKVELWRYNSGLVFKPGEWIDMDLLDENRSLLHTGKLLRQPDTGFEWNGWGELFVLLFDNYLVMTKVKEKDNITKYHVNRRPIPLDLLTLVNFTDPPTQRSTGILRGLRGGERHAGDGALPTPNGLSSPESAVDSRVVYPCTLHHNGRMGGPYILYAESAQVRAEWKQKLEEALGLRRVVQESNKVFEIETLSTDTFLVPPLVTATAPSWNESFTGKVTCSVPFNTADGRGLVAIGCAEGVWIGFRHDSRSMRRVLHLKQVTQCAMLENFGIFLVLADKSLFAYHIEALVPTTPNSTHASQTPEKLNGTKDVHFFSVGTLHGRTLVIYMKKKGLDSVFRVLEPVVERINDKTRAPTGIRSRLGLQSARSAWFRVYRDFFLPSESFDLIFLKAQIAILCTKGFEIMDLTDFKSVTIPQRDDPKLEKLAKRCESCRPLGMFRSTDDEFLLCYDEFGLYITKHGDPSRSTGTIEWEGTAERVAFHQPYILLFDSRFIEIRHVETGRLVQIIPGHDVRCIWDGRGLNSSGQNLGSADDGVEQEARVHGVMSPEGAGGKGAGKAVAQHVFELIPTIPLYLPGSLASPGEPSYFAQSFSPPHSPTLRPMTSYSSGGYGGSR